MVREFEHSVATIAPREVAWRYWSNLDNHARLEKGVVRIELDGAFATGTTGRTIAADFEQEWTLVEVVEGRRFVILGTTEDGRGTLSFAWDFEEVDEGTRLTQRITATGPDVAEQLPFFQEMERHAPAAMDRLADELDRVARLKEPE